ncbi:MAG: alpha-1,2-fucosyltransferase [Lachnospiraceae bacterium]|nr:alpha-1,2-fucosyltransferase [Lachnospiraceae bacterium]
MNIIRMTGGLGNQMFQYALYLKLKSMGRTVKMDDESEYHMDNSRPIMLWAFDAEYPKADKDEINELTDGSLDFASRVRRKLFGRKSLEYHEKDNNFDEQVLLREPAYLTGYFQSERYFADVKEQVRDAFRFSEKIWEEIPEKLKKTMKDYQEKITHSQAVAVHIRRGDYLEVSEVYGGICTEDYYRKAISLLKERFPGAVFYVFSNDPDWASQWAARYSTEENPFVVIEGTTEETGYLDLLLMSSCKHYIIANSSFSWWGAWLGNSPDKCVIAPSLWLNGKDCRDIYTEDMIRISPAGEVR